MFKVQGHKLLPDKYHGGDKDKNVDDVWWYLFSLVTGTSSPSGFKSTVLIFPYSPTEIWKGTCYDEHSDEGYQDDYDDGWL